MATVVMVYYIGTSFISEQLVKKWNGWEWNFDKGIFPDYTKYSELAEARIFAKGNKFDGVEAIY